MLKRDCKELYKALLRKIGWIGHGKGFVRDKSFYSVGAIMEGIAEMVVFVKERNAISQ